MQLTGIHHLTAITADAPANKRFYTDTLGLRLVKKTVNQDDTSAYHLFYADGEATPGTDLTFFDWPVAPERRGTHSISRTGLRVSGEEALNYWAARLNDLGVSAEPTRTVDGRATIDFEDPEGQRFRLVDDGGAGDAHPWALGPVPAAHQIRGLGPITMSVPDRTHTDVVLRELMFMRHVRDYPVPESDSDIVHVYEMGEGGPGAELHVAVRPKLPVAQPGAGGVHHVAFRTPNRAEYDAWAERLLKLRIPNSGKVDRYYFESLYFREPNGVLFEIATDGPGFSADEPMETLGEKLALPPFLEKRRADIERGLKPLVA
jgi:glyoxalase family protein